MSKIFKLKYLLPTLCIIILLIIGINIRYDTFNNLIEWHRQQVAKEYLSEYGWDVIECWNSTDVSHGSAREPLLGSHFMSQEIKSLYGAAFHNILLRDHIQLEPNTQYTVRWFSLSNYLLEDYPFETRLRADVLMHEDDVICAVVTWADVLHGFQVKDYVESLGPQWREGSFSCNNFSYNVMDPEDYYPVDWTVEQIRAAFDDALFAEAVIPEE